MPKIGRVAMVEALRFPGSIREATVNRTAGRWFACFAVETSEAYPPVKEGPIVGIDVGILTLAVSSTAPWSKTPAGHPAGGVKEYAGAPDYPGEGDPAP